MSFRNSAPLVLGACLLAAAGAAPPGAEQKSGDEETLKAASLAIDGPSLVAFFKKHTVGDVDRERIKRFIAELGDDSFAVREKASDTLLGIGIAARAPLREACQNPDVEIAVRATRLLDQIEKEGGPPVVSAAVRLLALRAPAGAGEALLAFVPAAEDHTVVDEVARALAVVGFKDRKPLAFLTDALADKLPLRRGVAAEALVRGGGLDQRSTGHKMLQDADATVRLRTALALFDTHDKEAIPALISLLVELPREQVWRAEDPLYVAAGDKAPTGSAGADEQTRRDYKKQWTQWWQDNGKDIDLAKLEQRQRLQGLNLICQLDLNKGAVGRIQEVDNDGKVKWTIDNLRYPVDAQMIGDDRVLVCEYSGRQVSERNLKGEVLWSKTTTTILLAARRLANGNTFIATRNSITEVDKDNKEVVSIARGNDISAAVRLRNGDYAIVTNIGQFIRLSPEGKELKSFPVGQVLAVGGNIEVLPNGRVLVPLYSQGKVVEYDAEGKKLWAVDVQQPSAVSRLPNGNLLVTCRTARAVIEIDRNGKEVWKQSTDGMPLKAFRR